MLRRQLDTDRLSGREGKQLANRTFSMMERQVENLSHLIDDLLEVSRVTRGKIGHDAGFQHYIVKPADPDEIARLIVV